MLHIELEADGGVTITGDAEALRQVALALLEAAVDGRSGRAFVSDQSLTRLLIRRLGED